MVFLAIFVMLLMLVVNYTYLAYSQLRTGEITDSLARIAVTELLDDTLLLPTPSLSQGDDIADAEAVVEEYVDRFNEVSPANHQLRYGLPGDNDITVVAGRVEDVTQPITSDNFITVGNIRRNTLAVEASRPKNGSNPLYLFVRAAFTPEAADIGSVSYATLDSRVIGFLPTFDTPVPLAPIAIEATAWQNRSLMTNTFEGSLKTAAGTGANNIVLLNYSDAPNSFDPSNIDGMLLSGVTPSEVDIDGGDFVGPAIEGTTVTTTLSASEDTPSSNAAAIASALNTVRLSDDPRRIFPLYDGASFNGPNETAEIIGFVAAKIVDVDYDASPGAEQIDVELEPVFIVHFTAVTAPTYIDGMNPAVAVPENVYIHKLRLSR